MKPAKLPSLSASLALVTAMGLMLLAFYLHEENSKLRSVNSRLISAQDHVYTLGRFEATFLSLGGLHQPQAPSSFGRKRLLLVAGDDEYTHRNLAAWRRLIEGIRWNGDEEVWWVSCGKQDSAASTCGSLTLPANIPCRWIGIDDPVRFSVETGIVSTPMTLLQDEEGRIELATAGELGHREIAVFRDRAEGRPTRPGRPFLKSSADASTSPLVLRTAN